MVTNDLKIHFDVLADIAQRGTRRAAAFVALGQRAWNDASIESVKLDVPFGFDLLPDPMPKELAMEVRSTFRQWISGSALAEIVQGLSLFADEFFKIAVYIAHNRKKITQSAMDRIEKFSNDTNLASKFKLIEDECGIKNGFIVHADGWARARNAHAHNRGIIRERDCNHNAGNLTISWRQFEVLIDDQRIENIIGHFVEKGASLGIRLGDGRKEFTIGSPIDFTEQEIVNLCLTTHVYSGQMVSELQKRLLDDIGQISTNSPPSS